MGTESLDARIRAKARKNLRKDIEEIALIFKRVMGVEFSGGAVSIQVCDSTNRVDVYARSAIDRFVDAAVNDRAPNVEDAAVAEFLDKFESMQDQIDELDNG